MLGIGWFQMKLTTTVIFYHYFFSDSGKIHLAKPIDFELMKSAVISVQATDNKHIVDKEIVVSIEDVNDNAPVFEKDTYQVRFSLVIH